jgi:hypothetical protein
MAWHTAARPWQGRAWLGVVLLLATALHCSAVTFTPGGPGTCTLRPPDVADGQYDPPCNVVNGNVSSGILCTVTCDFTFSPVNNITPGARCQGNGQWTSVTGSCGECMGVGQAPHGAGFDSAGAERGWGGMSHTLLPCAVNQRWCTF